jgi:hypothetical protein
MTMVQPASKAKRRSVRWGGNVSPIVPTPAPKPAPKHFQAPERKLWDAITANYVLDDDAALEVLATALEARSRMRRCRETIDRDGETIRDRWGQVRAHPLLVAERGARDSYLASLRLLNLDLSTVVR